MFCGDSGISCGSPAPFHAHISTSRSHWGLKTPCKCVFGLPPLFIQNDKRISTEKAGRKKKIFKKKYPQPCLLLALYALVLSSSVILSWSQLHLSPNSASLLTQGPFGSGHLWFLKVCLFCAAPAEQREHEQHRERATDLRELQSSGFGPAHRNPDLHLGGPAKP